MNFIPKNEDRAGWIALACAIAVFVAVLLDAPEAPVFARADRGAAALR
jgi:hypothetical protein